MEILHLYNLGLQERFDENINEDTCKINTNENKVVNDGKSKVIPVKRIK
ncbi:hypothetical protein L0P88_14595 [Muricauda sp. SCSIO 64092]|nr:hypothetical protein [Muricauda sp. SCSIO 64092]UOY05171.1 hypothetical protein L0P88_14595 [Muricauda sp. SCSIO 64092]